MSPSPPGRPDTTMDTHLRADVDIARYLAFSRTWGARWHQTGLHFREVEQRLGRFLRQACVWAEPTLVLEVGAHKAQFSRWAAEAFPEVPVVAYEANPFVHEQHAASLAEARVDYRHQAVGPVAGQIELHVPTEVRGRRKKRTTTMASLTPHRKAGGSIDVSVPCVRLDDEFHLGADDRVVAWVDVEGANAQVLESGPDLLSRVMVLHIEVESETTWEGQWLDTDVAAHLTRHGLVPVARDIQRRGHQYNVVFVRAEMVLDRRVTRRAARLLRGKD